MAKTGFSLAAFFGRVLKSLMVVLLLPLALGLLLGLREQLEFITLSGGTYRQWLEWGLLTYVITHLLLLKPVSLFRASHWVFSTLAVWLFGGQVATTDALAGGGKSGKGGKRGEGGDAPPAQGSPLVAFSPYVVPVFTVLACVLGWLLRKWWDRTFVDGPVSFLVGVTIALHWLMTAEELQQQRSRWHLETYLLALCLVFIVTLLIAAACLPWAVPELSFTQALGAGLSRTQAMYATLIQRLFF